MENWVQFVAGLAVLLVGGESLLRGTERIAEAARIPHYLVALTVIAFGSSAPELVVSLQAGSRGSSEIVFGNVLGSNIANLGLVVGSCATIRALAGERRLFRVEIPLLVILQVLLFLLYLPERSFRWPDGLLLLGIGLGYVLLLARTASRDRQPYLDLEPSAVPDPRRTWIAVGLSLLGLVLMPVGADRLLVGAQGVGAALGVSEVFIGMTLVAIGTSLPELVTSLLAVAKGQHSVALGTALGSNVFNLCYVLGITCLFFPVEGAPAHARAEWLDLAAALLITLALGAICWGRGKVSRGGGVVLLVLFGAVLGLAYVHGRAR